MPFPTNAKMTALVCTGLILPNVVGAKSKFIAGNHIEMAIQSPARNPTIPHIMVA